MAKNDNPHAVRLAECLEKRGKHQEAVSFSESHPLSKSATAEAKFAWAEHQCAFLTEHFDNKTVKDIRMDCACGSELGKGDFCMSILQTEKLTKVYGKGENAVCVLDGVSISIEKGEFTAIVGSSGSGKSTLVNMIGGLDRPTSGKVTVSGNDIFSMKDDALTIFRRRKIGFVFQNYNLVPVLNVYENIVLPIELDGIKIDAEYVKSIGQHFLFIFRIE